MTSPAPCSPGMKRSSTQTNWNTPTVHNDDNGVYELIIYYLGDILLTEWISDSNITEL